MISNQSDESFDVTITFSFAQLNPRTQRFDCHVCGVNNMSEADFDVHKALEQHKRKAKETATIKLKKMFRCAHIVSKPLLTNIAKLEDIGDDRKRDAIEAALFRSVIGDDDNAYQTAMTTVVKTLQSYNHKERLVALALAVWKTQCILDTRDLSPLATLEWNRSGWKENKAQHRESSAMDIVVMAVQPFLSLDDEA